MWEVPRTSDICNPFKKKIVKSSTPQSYFFEQIPITYITIPVLKKATCFKKLQHHLPPNYIFVKTFR